MTSLRARLSWILTLGLAAVVGLPAVATSCLGAYPLEEWTSNSAVVGAAETIVEFAPPKIFRWSEPGRELSRPMRGWGSIPSDWDNPSDRTAGPCYSLQASGTTILLAYEADGSSTLLRPKTQRPGSTEVIYAFDEQFTVRWGTPSTATSTIPPWWYLRAVLPHLATATILIGAALAYGRRSRQRI